MQIQKIIICDIDETVAHLHGRDYYDWDTVSNDWPIEYVVDLLKRYAIDHKIVFMTGRSQVCYTDTLTWLLDNRIPVDLLVMKPKDSTEDSALFKEKALNQLSMIFGKYKVTLAIDDRTKIIDMWKRNGIPTLKV